MKPLNHRDHIIKLVKETRKKQNCSEEVEDERRLQREERPSVARENMCFVGFKEKHDPFLAKPGKTGGLTRKPYRSCSKH